MPLELAMEAFRIMEPPSFISGNAFCTVKKRPFTLTLKCRSKFSSVTRPKSVTLLRPALANRMSIWPCSDLMVAFRRSRSLGRGWPGARRRTSCWYRLRLRYWEMECVGYSYYLFMYLVVVLLCLGANSWALGSRPKGATEDLAVCSFVG
jgi:hypothetical protein